MRTSRLHALLPLALVFVAGCQPPAKDPANAMNDLVKDFGYIGFQNPLSNASTGTLIGGKPSAVSFVAQANDCFSGEAITRHTDHSEYSKTYSYTFQGSLGFLLSGNPIFSAGLNLNKNVFVKIELTGLITEYMSSIDVTDWYTAGMSNTCRQYLNDVGFIIQALKAEKLTMSFVDKSNNNINLNADNISQYIKFNIGTQWEIIDSTTVVVTTPKYIGYQLGRLRLEDDGRTLWRATSVKDQKYLFERIALFDDQLEEEVPKASKAKSTQLVDDHAVYVK